MRMTRLFGRTLRELPADATTASHQLLLKAGLIQPLVAGVYDYLPIGWRVLRKIEEIIRQEMNATGAQEVHLPALQPIELWQESGRDKVDVLFHLKDGRGRDLVLGPTHEEVITDLVRRTVQSYRDLPVNLYQIQTKFRDELRPRGGLARVREFTMKDAYSFDYDAEGLDVSYQAMRGAYRRIFDRCGIETIDVEADSGAIGGKDSREFMMLTETGDDSVLVCSNCDYAANAERALFTRPDGLTAEIERPVEPVATPGIKTIAELSQFLGVEPRQTLKAVLYSADGQLVFVLVRGDLDVNEVKLGNLLKATRFGLATDEQIRAAGLVAGFASPIGVSGVRVFGDESIQQGNNFVAGGNKPDVHLINVNYPRDFAVDQIADLALAQDGALCARCGGRLTSSKGVELGHVFKLGTRYSETMDATFLDRDGSTKPILMGCYGIGVGRLLSAVVEACHDDKGIIWPTSIAPYQIHLVGLGMDDPNIAREAESVYGVLLETGYEVLFDDRVETPGVKFNDADLLGVPVRVTVSKRTLAKEAAEVKRREHKEFVTVPLAEIVPTVNEIYADRKFVRIS